jgi:HEAT repeat protein
VAEKDGIMQELLAAVARQDDEAAERLAQTLTPADEPRLQELLTSSSVDARWWAVRGLALVGSAHSVPRVAARLQDGDPTVRAAAALALAHLYPKYSAEVVAQLAAVADLLDDDEGVVRQTAADCLSLCGDDAVSALGHVLRVSEHQGARTRAAGALRKIATMKAAAILYALLNDSNHLVRAYAYEGLDEMGLLENVLVIPQ